MRRKKPDGVPYDYALQEALGQPGCPLCRLLADGADRLLDAVLWEMVNDPALRQELNQARGYCPRHTWLLVREGAALGVAILSRGVIQTLLRVLDENRAGGEADTGWQGFRRSRGRQPGKEREALVAALEPQRPCPVCVQQAALEETLLHALLSGLHGAGALAAVYAESDGLCLAHFRQALAQAGSPSQSRPLVEAQQQVWQRLEAELAEFIRKKDHRFKDEPFGPERDAWRRALAALAGPPPRSRSGRQGLTTAN
ncbi:MAG: DUF6062 family protein [Anaerolineae bacterium]|jgi:hypothetical protein